ncbi:DUF3034 family protein [Hydrocarboniphaga effusa]|uniref:DUF3034 family protein n=1 Tax=Hydrocarboniphaga effusa TaxID=243629 RepID=UPI0035AFE454
MKGSKANGSRWIKTAAFAALSLFSTGSWAGMYNDGKVFLTGGVFTVDGAGGGGAVPWATITGYESRDGINGGVGFTYVRLPNYDINWIGGSVGFYDRFELSYVNVKLTTDLSNVNTVAMAADALGLAGNLGLDPHGSKLQMDTYGAKVRLFGDAVYTSDSFIPQTSLGFLYKNNTTPEFTRTLSADKAKDWEAYLAFTKVFFRYSTLVNLTVRYSAANQIGLTGFGECNNGRTECDDDKDFRFEFSTAYLLQKNFAIGGEYQQHSNKQKNKPVDAGNLLSTNDNGDALLNPLIGGIVGGVVGATGLRNTLAQNESDWYDFFFAYAPNKNYSLTFAYLFLGDIAVAREQNGLYFSLHATF